MTAFSAPQPRPDFQWIDKQGRPTQAFAQYMTQLDPTVRNLAGGSAGAVPWVTPQQFGAVADGVTDDSAAIQAAINSLTTGGMVLFGNKVYAIGAATAITLPTDRSITLMGMGRGDSSASPGTLLRATDTMSAMIASGNSFFRGHRISSMTLDGDILADYNLDMQYIDASLFDNLQLENAKAINFRLGVNPNNVQENLVHGVRISNDKATVSSDLPLYNFEVSGSNNDFAFIKATAAQSANFHDIGIDNVYDACHGYADFGGTSTIPDYCFLFDIAESNMYGCETDGANIAQVQLNCGGMTISGCTIQGTSAGKGIRIGNGHGSNSIFGNVFRNIATADCIVQVGTAASPGNFFYGNVDLTNGVVLPTRLVAPVIVANLPVLGPDYAGAVAMVSNATATTFHSIVAGGGANKVMVMWDGANWRIGG